MRERQRAALDARSLLPAAVLALAPGDADALKCRVIVLIQYDEFQQALDALAISDAVASDLVFEKVKRERQWRTMLGLSLASWCMHVGTRT